MTHCLKILVVDGHDLRAYFQAMRRLVLILFCLPLLLMGCFGSPRPLGTSAGLTEQEIALQRREASASDALAKALQLYHNEEFLDVETAKEYLDQAIQLDPTLVPARQYRAMLLLGQNRLDEALIDAEEVLKVKPDHTKAQFTVGFIQYNKGEYRAAIRAFSKVVKLDRNISEAYALRGASYSRLGHFQDAIKDFSRTLAMNPAHREAYYNRGLANMQLGNLVRAIYDLTQALTLDSQSIETLTARAAAYSKLGQFDKAVEDFQRAVDLAPSDNMLHALLADTQASNGNYEAAKQSADKAALLAEALGDDELVRVYKGMAADFAAKALSPPVSPRSKTGIPDKKGVPVPGQSLLPTDGVKGSPEALAGNTSRRAIQTDSDAVSAVGSKSKFRSAPGAETD
ncbi:tetratricopeptide repeat protein [Pseudodesulfovibrio piezophilus]|nr:tetratricopeptide repeat protein [Pseudodesulfovibrio piezophilus]